MVMKTRYILAISVILNAMFSIAQDIHFTQFEYSPMNLNPALVGANSPMQGIVNYRNQWSRIGEPYQTIAASFDARFNENKRRKKGIIAGGISLFNDQAGTMNVTTNSVSLNLAYHLILNRESTLGLGLQGVFAQRSISTSGGEWASQYDGLGYNPLMSTGEDFNHPSFSYMDVGAGLLYTYKMKGGYMTQNTQRRVNFGFSAFHLNRPNYSFLNNENEQLAMRFSGFINADFGIKNTRGILQPGIYYHRQGGHQEIMIGTNYGYIIHTGSKATGFTRPITAYLGFFYRFQDAAVARFMFEYDLFSLGFAYDINLSSLTPVTKTVGGFELFLRYNLGDGGGFRNLGKINRHRF
jgi:type IX secretion system PorP/SprF family membrane protein